MRSPKLLHVALVLSAVLAGCAGPSKKAEAFVRWTAGHRSQAEARVLAAQGALQSAARDPRPWIDLGRAWTERARTTLEPGHVQRAHDAFVRAEALGGGEDARRGLVELILLRESADEALRAIDERWTERAHDPRWIALRAEALLLAGRDDEADELLRGVVQRDPAIERARVLVLRERGELDAALARASELAKSATDDPDAAREALALTAELAIAARVPDRAIAAANELLARDALDADGTAVLARLEAERGELRAALVRCERWLTGDECPRLRALAASCARELGDEEVVLRDVAACERAIRPRPKPSGNHVLRALAELYVAANANLGEALTFARRRAETVRTRDARGLVERVELATARASTPRP